VTADTYFLTLFVRNQSLFEEARETYETEGELYGLAALDTICDKLELYDELEELAESYVRGEYDPLD
jgi:hypothetical protein